MKSQSRQDPGKTRLYHKDVRPTGPMGPNLKVEWPPKEVVFPDMFVHYSRHADVARTDDRNGYIPPIAHLPKGEVVEWEVDMETLLVVKVVVRTPLDARRDRVTVVQPDGLIRTEWINLKSDGHRTLHKETYCQLAHPKIDVNKMAEQFPPEMKVKYLKQVTAH